MCRRFLLRAAITIRRPRTVRRSGPTMNCAWPLRIASWRDRSTGGSRWRAAMMDGWVDGSDGSGRGSGFRQPSSYPTIIPFLFDPPNFSSPVRPRSNGLTKPKHKAYSRHCREINISRIDAVIYTVTSARFSSPSASVNCSPSEGLLYSIKTGCSPKPDVKRKFSETKSFGRIV